MHVSSDESVPGWGCCCHSAQGCWPLAAVGCTALVRTHVDGHYLQAGSWTPPFAGWLVGCDVPCGWQQCFSALSWEASGSFYLAPTLPTKATVMCVAFPQIVCECARTCTVQPPLFCFAVGCQQAGLTLVGALVSCSVSWPVTNLVQASAHDRGPCLSATLADIPSYFQSFFLCVWSEQCSAQHCRPLLLVFVVVLLWMLMLLGKHTHTDTHRPAGPFGPGSLCLLSMHASHR